MRPGNRRNRDNPACEFRAAAAYRDSSTRRCWTPCASPSWPTPSGDPVARGGRRPGERSAAWHGRCAGRSREHQRRTERPGSPATAHPGPRGDGHRSSTGRAPYGWTAATAWNGRRWPLTGSPGPRPRREARGRRRPRLDDGSPCVDVRLDGGYRVHAVLPPISTAGTLLSVRIRRATVFSMSELRRHGMFGTGTSGDLVQSGARTMVGPVD